MEHPTLENPTCNTGYTTCTRKPHENVERNDQRVDRPPERHAEAPLAIDALLPAPRGLGHEADRFEGIGIVEQHVAELQKTRNEIPFFSRVDSRSGWVGGGVGRG